MTFNGFISYSHAADGRLAPAVQRGLHRLAKPWHRRRALWLFRDQTGLAVTPALWSSIEAALDGSEYFVLLASPEAAHSRWVNREIEHWVATKPADRILPVLTDGEWRWDPDAKDFDESSTAVPSALRGVFSEEPLFLDLRWARDEVHLNLRHSRFRDAIAQLAAPMHGVTKDDLEGEDVRQHRQARRLWSAAATTLVVLALVASFTGVMAVRNADRANAAAMEAGRQQQLMLEQRGSAERFAAEAHRQEELAGQQEERAKKAAEEARRQEQAARKQKGIAGQASAEARWQLVLADQAAARASEQKLLAQKAAARATEQKLLAQKATAEARRQEQAAQKHERLAQEAAEEARRQESNADRQRRIGISQRLVNEAVATVGADPQTALRLALAAGKVQPGAETRNKLKSIVTSTHYAATIKNATMMATSSRGVLATAGGGEDVSLWTLADSKNPTRLGTLRHAGQRVHDMTFSPDGRTLDVLDGSGTNLWDVSDPAHPVRLALLAGKAHAVAISPDGRTIVTRELVTGPWHPGAPPPRPVTTWSLWDVADRTKPIRLSTRFGGVNDVAFSSDGRALLDAGLIWDVTDRSNPVQVGSMDGGISRAVSPKGSLAAVATLDGQAVLWDFEDPARPKRERTLTGNAGMVQSVAFSPDGRILASGDEQGTVTLTYVADQSRFARPDRMVGAGGVQSMAFSHDGRSLVTLRDSGAMTVWNVPGHAAPEPLRDLPAGNGVLSPAEFSRDGRSLMTGTWGWSDESDGQATFWDVSKPARPVRQATLNLGPDVASVAFSGDGRTMAVHKITDGVALWDVTQPGRPVTLATIPNSPMWSVPMVFSPDGRTLAMQVNGGLALWDLANRSRPTRLAKLASLGFPSDNVAFSADGRTLAVAEEDQTVVLWDMTVRAAPVKLNALAGHRGEVLAAAFSPDGRTLAVGSENDAVALWDISDRAHARLLSTWTIRAGLVTSAAFSPDGRILVLGGGLWDVTDRTKPFPLAMTRGSHPAFSPDGHTLVVGGTDDRDRSIVTLLDYKGLSDLRANPERYACSIADRGLTAAEWARYIPELPYQRSCPG